MNKGETIRTPKDYAVAIILHMLMDTFPALYQRSVVPLWTVELWVGVWTGVVVFIAVNLYRKMKQSSSSESIW